MKRTTSILTAAALVCALVSFPAAAADLVGVDYSDAGINFTPNVAADYFQLRVSGPEGLIFTQNDKFFSLSDALGALPDGVYTWEAVMAPAAPLKRGFDEGLDRQAHRAGGSFTIQNGALVDRDLEESGAAVEKLAVDVKANVINDDQVVKGSLCVGTDCDNSPSFGFDTIRMEENNVRIKAQDTSSTGSFPSTDWQLTFNESSNGGLDKFSVEDTTNSRTPFTIEANAPNNALYVENDGHVGIGTNSPTVHLHVKDGNSPALRLEQDGSDGFTSYTWDIFGNEAGFFVRDISNGSKLPLKIEDGAPNNSIVIDAEGNIGLSKGSPEQALHIKRSSGVVIRMENTSATNDGWDFAAFNNGTMVFSDPDDGNAEFVLDDVGNLTITGTLSDASDVNMKENFSTVDSGEVLRKVAELPLTTWNYLHTPDQTHLGPMAQDFYAAFGLGAGETVVQSRNIASVALAAIQGLNDENEELKARIAALEALVEKLVAE